MPRELILDLPNDSVPARLELSAQIYGYAPGDGIALPAEVELCYHELFPIVEERDLFSDMRLWLEAAHDDANLEYRECLAILFALDRPVGLAYFTIYPFEGWAFANYLGISPEFRRGHVARRFVHAVQRFATQNHPGLRGALFEVEVLDEHVFDATTAAPEDAAVRLRRLAAYASQPDIAIAQHKNGSPLIFRQPALAAPLGPTGEVPLYLMRQNWSHGADAASVAQAVRFILFRIYGDVYIEGETSIDGFGPYVSELERRILGEDPESLHWAPFSLTPSQKRLLAALRRRDAR